MKKLFIIMVSFLLLFLSSYSSLYAQSSDSEGAASCLACGTCGSFGVLTFVVIPVVIFILQIALLIWVVRDSKARSMDNPVVWMIVVFLVPLIGIVVYMFSRPQGTFEGCQHCSAQKLTTVLKCPHCGFEKGTQ